MLIMANHTITDRNNAVTKVVHFSVTPNEYNDFVKLKQSYPDATYRTVFNNAVKLALSKSKSRSDLPKRTTPTSIPTPTSISGIEYPDIDNRLDDLLVTRCDKENHHDDLSQYVNSDSDSSEDDPWTSLLS
jgi:hypothetical protein